MLPGSPEFLVAAHHLAQLPDDSGSEVAVAGRSNAGKSTAINAITGMGSLARTSKTPGRTQQLVVFALAPDCRLVDMPGYGYARVSDAMRRHWGRVLGDYLVERRSLKGVILIVDVRRGLLSGDRQLIGLCASAGRPVHVLLTKADKLGRGRGLVVQRALAAELPGVSFQLFSGRTGAGVGEARERILGWLQKKEGPGT